VPLSEDEQRILDEIEKGLYKEDPQFAREVRRTAPQMSHFRRLKAGAFVFVVGLVLLFGFFATQQILIGVAAFGTMVGGIFLFAGSARDISSAHRAPGPGRKERLTSAFGEWEARLRQRYKKR
jgi:Protein of unknown function (DUF3040)